MKYEEVLQIQTSLNNLKNRIGSRLTDDEFEELKSIIKQLEQLIIHIDDISDHDIKNLILFLIGLTIKIFVKPP